ncbi:hypothetical protein [Stella sp.]|uniref:hypothetical protein n=1 Tax=Stella sp. TaxID=2912054 RepID=UPI0035AE81C5
MTAPTGSRPRVGPYSALMPGGGAAAVAAGIAALRAQTMLPADIWVLQPDHDPAVVAQHGSGRLPAVRILRQDRPPPAWAPLLFTWFLPSSYTLLLAPGARPAPHFAETALATMRRHRAMICAAGSRRGAAVAAGAADQAIDLGEGAWFFETHWIRHAWAAPPGDLDGDPMPAFAAALRRARTPLAVPALPDGTAAHLLS